MYNICALACMKRIAKRKGVGPVIVSVFMVAILLLGYGVFQLVFQRTTEFSGTLKINQQFLFEKSREDLTVLGNPFNENDCLNITLVNVGEVEVRITWLAVIDPSNRSAIFGYKKIDPSIILKPEETSQAICGEDDWVFPGGYKGKTGYIIQAVTDRGTAMNYLYPNPERQPVKGVTKHLVIGPFIFEFNPGSFTYTSKDKGAPQPGYEIRDDEDKITFLVQIKNYHNESMKIDGNSYMLLVIPKQPTSDFHETELSFCIVDEASTNEALIAYNKDNPLTIMPDQTVVLKFGSKEPFKTAFNSDDCLRGSGSGKNEPGTENLVTTFIVIFWEYGDSGKVIGQTIPFVSIHLPKYDP